MISICSVFMLYTSACLLGGTCTQTQNFKKLAEEMIHNSTSIIYIYILMNNKIYYSLCNCNMESKFMFLKGISDSDSITQLAGFFFRS